VTRRGPDGSATAAGTRTGAGTGAGTGRADDAAADPAADPNAAHVDTVQVNTSDADAGGAPRAGASAADAPGTSTGREPAALPAPGIAHVHIVSASPETARMIAEVLRLRFATTEQRSYPAGDESGGTRLSLSVDTVHIPEASGPFQLRLVGGGKDERPPPRQHTSTTPDGSSGDGPTT
jgi:hypothetical protein